jgi:amidase
MVDPFASAGAMLAALRSQAVSAVELLDLHLERIERYNSELNAIVSLDAERARAAARAADERRAGGEDLPLLGLPVTIKEAIDVDGLPTTSGVPRRAEAFPARDAPVVQRIRDAGAVIVGKTNVPPYAGDWQTDNPLFGRTVNPWDPERTPGGSTGGGAAAVAAGLSPLEIGSDIGGSIRLPAAFCGIYGHKPSADALPRQGHFPGFAAPHPALTLNVLGPLARSADDLALAFGVLSDGWRETGTDRRYAALDDFRVAVLPPIAWLPVEPSITAALDDLTAYLRLRGAAVADAQPDLLGDLRAHHRLYERLLAYEFSLSADIPMERHRQYAAELLRLDDEFARARAAGILATDEHIAADRAEQERHRQSWRDFFRHWDVLLAPVTFTTAFPHDARSLEERTLLVDGHSVPYRRLMVYPALASLSGLPATACPHGFTADRLPIGLQVIGPPGEDVVPIQFAALLERELGGYEPPPGFD